MNHYIIVKFRQGYEYIYELDKIIELFNKSLNIDGVNSVDVYKSNSDLNNRYDLMIKMDLTKDGLINFDNSWIHDTWKKRIWKIHRKENYF